jgi:hypothetical protein
MIAPKGGGGRRNWLLGTACLAALAIFSPRRALAQTFTATSISQAAQEARREVGRLGRRADNLLRLTVADGPDRGGSAIRRFRAEQAPLARNLAAILNSRVSEDDWLLVVPTRELDFVLTMRPLVIRLAPTAGEIEVLIKQPLAQIEPLPGDGADDVLLTIVLTALGLERRVALFEELRNSPALAAALKDAAAAVTARRYGLAALELERLMRDIMKPEAMAAIAGTLGKDAIQRLYKALIVHFVPFVGWSFFTARLLVTLYFNRDTTAPVLR